MLGTGLLQLLGALLQQRAVVYEYICRPCGPNEQAYFAAEFGKAPKAALLKCINVPARGVHYRKFARWENT